MFVICIAVIYGGYVAIIFVDQVVGSVGIDVVVVVVVIVVIVCVIVDIVVVVGGGVVGFVMFASVDVVMYVTAVVVDVVYCVGADVVVVVVVVDIIAVAVIYGVVSLFCCRMLLIFGRDCIRGNVVVVHIDVTDRDGIGNPLFPYYHPPLFFVTFFT